VNEEGADEPGVEDAVAILEVFCSTPSLMMGEDEITLTPLYCQQGPIAGMACTRSDLDVILPRIRPGNVFRPKVGAEPWLQYAYAAKIFPGKIEVSASVEDPTG